MLQLTPPGHYLPRYALQIDSIYQIQTPAMPVPVNSDVKDEWPVLADGLNRYRGIGAGV